MSEQTLLSHLGRLAAETSIDSLPLSVAEGLPSRVLDIVGLAIAATRLETSGGIVGFAEECGGSPAATGLGLADKTSAPMAAFVNGCLAHSLDFDDTHLPSILHPSASVVPASLAAAESVDATGHEMLAAIAVGLEITIRLGMAGYRPASDDVAGQSIYFEHGQHATSICGAIGSAAAAAKLFGLDALGCQNAMAVSASMASGIIEANRTGGTVKRMHCGWAAQAGVTAAMLTKRNMTGAPTALEGRFGLFQALLRDEWDATPVTSDLGQTWLAADVFYKPYPANHFTHGGIDAGMELASRGLKLSDIESAVLSVASPTVRTIGEPLATKQAPETGYQAQFSGPFTVAAAIRGGGGLGLGLKDFSDTDAQDVELREAMAKITVTGSPVCDEIYPLQFPAVLEVRTTAGETLRAEILANRGGNRRPLSSDELAKKFEDCTDGLLSDDQRNDVRSAIVALGATDGGRVQDIFEPLAGQRFGLGSVGGST